MTDFADKRAACYDALALPADANTFIAKVQHDMHEALPHFDRELPRNPKVRRRAYGDHRTVLTPLDAEPAPAHLEHIKAEVLLRWPMTGLTEALRREVHAGLNLVENWNSANEFVFYGRSGEIASNRLDDQELAMLALHLLQACLVYINTLMLQQVLAEPTWLTPMSPEDFRALTPLIDHHVNP